MRKQRLHGMNLGLAMGKLTQIFTGFWQERTLAVDWIQIIMLM